MKQIWIFLLFGVCYSYANGQGAVIMQDKSFLIQHTTDPHVLKVISRERSYNLLSDIEKEVVYWLGVLRKDPKSFRVDIIKPFLSQFPELQGASARSLERELALQEPLSILLPAENLDRTASSHAQYLFQSNRFSHIGAKGKTFQHRMAEAGVRSCAGENLFEGKSDALVSVILLLIDQGVEGYGHRKVLLNPSFAKVGVGAVPEGNGTMVMVQVFSCQ